MISRRDFVSSAGTVLVLGRVPAALIAAPKGGSTTVTFADGLRKSTFGALLLQDFYVLTGSYNNVVLQLATIKDGATTQGRVKTEGYTLYFGALTPPALPEGLYTLEHVTAGKVTLYLEPAKMVDGYATYRAQVCILV